MPDSIWLEMENARVKSGNIEIQIKGDRTEKEQPWWPVIAEALGPGESVSAVLRTLFEALEKKRVVLAELKAPGGALVSTTQIAPDVSGVPGELKAPDGALVSTTQIAPGVSGVPGELKAKDNALICTGIRIQYSESERR